MPNFIKKTEDFVCGKCGFRVKGDGYTNHCPKCLWSKHMDINPGDREADCGGLMKPVDVYFEKQEWILTHECEICGYKKRNRVSKDDDFDKVIELSKKINDSKTHK